MRTNEQEPNFDQTLLNLFDALNDRPIVYHGIYSQIMGTTSAGLVASQLIYWSKVMGHQQFYKTDAEICDELKMGSKELRNAKKRIIESGVFDLTVKGVPPRTYYKINLKKLINLINNVQAKGSETGQINLAQRDKLKYPNRTNQFSPKGQIITEMTTEINKEDNNNTSRVVKCSMATGKKRIYHVKQKPSVQPKPQLEPIPKVEEPNGVVVDCEINDLVRMVKVWAISRVMIEAWVKKYGIEYVLQKIELTQSAISQGKVRSRGAYLNKAIEFDWLPPASLEAETALNKQVETIYPTHEENILWYNNLAQKEKIMCLKTAIYKQGYFEEHLKNAKASVLDANFTDNYMFKSLMQYVGRAP